MALMDVKFYSESLGMQTECYVVIPQSGSSNKPGMEKSTCWEFWDEQIQHVLKWMFDESEF